MKYYTSMTVFDKILLLSSDIKRINQQQIRNFYYKNFKNYIINY